MTDETKNTQSEAKAKAERKAYKLKRAHRHGGVLFQEGDSLHLTAEQAERLRKANPPKI